MATKDVARLPYGMGRLGGIWWALAVVSLAVLALGIYAYSVQFSEGEVVTGMRDIGTGGGAPWGIYISFVVFFIGVSFAGITVAALIRLLNLEHLRPVSRMAELLTVVSLILGALSVLVDIGQPLRGIVNLLQYARPQSPFFGTMTLVISGYLFASLVFLYLSGRRDAAACAQIPSRLQWFHRLWAAGYKDTPAERERHAQTSRWLALAILPLLVTAHSTLGFVFGIQGGRPGWFSALQAPGFVVLAGVSGIGALIIIAAALRRLPELRGQIGLPIFRWLGNLLWVLALIYLYLMLAEWLTANYAGQQHESNVTAALLTGPYAWLFWLSVAMLAIPFLLGFAQFMTGTYSVGLMVLSGFMVNVAAVGKRVLIVVPSLTQGTVLPYPPGSYTPTWVEYSIILGLFALGTLLYILFVKVFPIMEVSASEQGGAR